MNANVGIFSFKKKKDCKKVKTKIFADKNCLLYKLRLKCECLWKETKIIFSIVNK